MGVHAPTLDVGEHVTIDDQMRPGQFLRRVTALAGDAFDTSVEPIVETDGGLYAIEFALCRAPLEGVVVRKRPAEVLGIARSLKRQVSLGLSIRGALCYLCRPSLDDSHRFAIRMAHVFNMSQCLPFLPDGSLDGGWGALPELLEFGDFIEPYWDSNAEKDLNTLRSPQPPMLSPLPPAPSPPPPVLLSSPVCGPRLVRAHPPTPPPVTLGDPITPRTQYYLSRHTLAEYLSWEQLVMFNLKRYSFAVEHRGPLLLPEQGMCVSRSSFVLRSEELAWRLMRRGYYLQHPAPPPQTPQTTAHSIEPL